ncbi:MAG TPA: hypothetical protein VLE20_08380 [Blastocatellia bacterium]|nr:hypothetical protein [Blastocatellia bacterium]
MNRTTQRSISFAASIVLVLSSFALAAHRAEAAGKYYKVTGQVLEIDAKERTLLVTDRTNERLYLVRMPEGSSLKITWGRYMRMAGPGFGDVFNKDRVEIRCFRPNAEHLAQLDDGRTAIKLTAASF